MTGISNSSRNENCHRFALPPLTLSRLLGMGVIVAGCAMIDEKSLSNTNTQEGDSMATTSEHELAELKRELAELAKQAERLAGRAREISDRLRRD